VKGIIRQHDVRRIADPDISCRVRHIHAALSGWGDIMSNRDDRRVMTTIDVPATQTRFPMPVAGQVIVVARQRPSQGGDHPPR
jgi:hypothetical protein